MERLIRLVRRHPCLWDVNHLDYRDPRPKDEAWELVAKECGMKNGFEAKFNWKKLRDSHREALRRRRIKPTVSKPWKYEEQMKFILGDHSDMSAGTIDIEFRDTYNEEETFVQEVNMVYDDTVESPYSSPSHIEADSKADIQNHVQRVQQDELRDVDQRDVDASMTSQQQQDALSTLFDSLCQKTRVLPKYLQLRVQREVFEAVLRAEEEALSLDPLGTIQSSCSLNRASSSYGPSSSTK
ncbi:alcohol dehydrogenase transcription factor myb/SANT-like domain-containing protein [Phthorimaea operculella]|nr:alcohol dehydrogenase transcription factor myb/SANT-like domain-containing protein [Phthorimaea operculella]